MTDRLKVPRGISSATSIRLGSGLAVLVGGLAWLWRDGRNPAAGVLVGTGIVLAVEGSAALDRERRKQREDLDETRRVLYMAYAVSAGTYSVSPELAGTIANALAHHYRRISREEADSLAQSLFAEAVAKPAWIRDRLDSVIDEITKELGDEAPASN